MAHQIIGRIYFQKISGHFSDPYNPVFYGYPLFSYISTNRWPFIEVDFKECQRILKGKKDEHPQIIKDLCEILISNPPINFFREGSDNHTQILPSLFSPYKCFLIDVLALIAIKMGKLDFDDVSYLHSEWTQDKTSKVIPSLLGVDSEINEVIDYLLENQVRISAVSEQAMLPFPDLDIDDELQEDKTKIERYDNLGQLWLNCYSPNV